jgi:hypothetical protein
MTIQTKEHNMQRTQTMLGAAISAFLLIAASAASVQLKLSQI